MTRNELQQKIAVKVYSQKELAGLYEICPRTFKNWIRPHEDKIGKKVGRYYSPVQIETIFDVIGLPKNYVE